MQILVERPGIGARDCLQVGVQLAHIILLLIIVTSVIVVLLLMVVSSVIIIA